MRPVPAQQIARRRNGTKIRIIPNDRGSLSQLPHYHDAGEQPPDRSRELSQAP